MRMAEVMRTNVKRAMEEVVDRLTRIRGWGRWKGTGEGVGIDPAAVTRLLDEAGLVLLRVEQVGVMVARMRRCFTAFFHWLAYAVSVAQKEEEGEGEAAQPSGPFDLDEAIECIQSDLFSDRLAQPLSSPPSHATAPVTSPLLPVSVIPAAESSVSLLSALDSLRTAFAAFTLAPCAAVSARIAQAQRRAEDSVTVIRELHGGLGASVGDEDVSLHADTKAQRMLMAFSFVHPLLPHPILVVTSTPAGTAADRGRPARFMMRPCPGLTESSHATVVSVAFFSATRLLVMVRYTVQRRSSELKLLHDRERMMGNVYTRLHEVDLEGRDGWQEMREKERRQQGLSLVDWMVGEWERSQGAIAEKVRAGKQRSMYGDCGRSLIVGRERGVCAVLLTALQPHRARQQSKRVLLIDLMDDEEEDQQQQDMEGVSEMEIIDQ